jgi:hypothetical protein
MRQWLCALALWSAVAHGAQDDTLYDAPIRRIIIYKDGHCFTERALTLEKPATTLFLSNLPHAVSGTVWASAERGATVRSLQARWLDWTRSIPVQNTTELLMLNDGARLEIELLVSAGAESAPLMRLYTGILRVFKPELRYQDAYPNADAPPQFTPPKPEEPDPRVWGYYRVPTEPTDFVQDEWSRAAAKATFAVESEQGLIFFKPEQIQRLKFIDTPKRTRTVTVRRPVLELSLDGAQRGAEVKVYALERGIRWTPEYQLLLPQGDEREATLVMNAVVLNELEPLHGVQAAVVVGAPQFMLENIPSPMTLRDTFRKLSRWFTEEMQNQATGFAGAPRIVPMADSSETGARTQASKQPPSPDATEPITLIKLPALSAPKESAVRVEITRQKTTAERVCVWVRDLDMREPVSYWQPYWASPQTASFRALEDIAYRTAQARRFRDEVQEAFLLRNTGDLAWTTGSALILQDGAPLGQDILFRTEPGGEAYLVTGPAHGISVAVSGYSFDWRATTVSDERPKQRVVVRVLNQRKEPTRVIVRLRFLGEFVDATRTPTRLVVKTHTFADPNWYWYYVTEARDNPRTELVWDFVAPPGESTWEYYYTRR